MEDLLGRENVNFSLVEPEEQYKQLIQEITHFHTFIFDTIHCMPLGNLGLQLQLHLVV